MTGRWVPAVLLACAAMLPGCATRPVGSDGTATGAMTVTFSNLVNPIYQANGLIVVVESGDDLARAQVVARLSARVPGRYAEFVVRLDLPPGSYRISRLMGTAADSRTPASDARANPAAATAAPQFDVAVDVRFVLRAGEADYLGRLELVNAAAARGDTGSSGSSFAGPLQAVAGFANGSPRLAITDSREADLPGIVLVWPELRSRKLESHLPSQVLISKTNYTETLAAEGTRADAGANGSGEFSSPPRLGTGDGIRLNTSAQAAFAAFLKQPLPRAFAISPGAATGTASGGSSVIDRAVKACAQRARHGPEPCRLFAVDNTLVDDSMQALLMRKASSPGQAGQAGHAAATVATRNGAPP